MAMLFWEVPETLGEGHQLEEVDHGVITSWVISCPIFLSHEWPLPHTTAVMVSLTTIRSKGVRL